jgi:hypothetical protein
MAAVPQVGETGIGIPPLVTTTPVWLQILVGRDDPGVWQEPGRRLRVRLAAPGQGAWEVVLAA